MVTIEPVPVSASREAIRFLAEARAADIVADAQADALRDMIRGRDPASIRLWWACRRQCVAAAAVFANPGRTGYLMYCPMFAPGVETEALADVVRAVSADAIRDGLSFVQTLMQADAAAEVGMVRCAGLRHIADLIYMKMDAGAAAAPCDPPEVSWRHHGQFSDDLLARVITETYAQSLDCPVLYGLREMKDVIAGHKACGVFRPDSWWIVDWLNVPAGCILVNDDRLGQSCDVVYAGVRPEFRGRGLAALMIRHAAADARSRSRRSVTLAVDSVNHYASAVYNAQGFRPVQRRLAYAMLPESRA